MILPARTRQAQTNSSGTTTTAESRMKKRQTRPKRQSQVQANGAGTKQKQARGGAPARMTTTTTNLSPTTARKNLLKVIASNARTQRVPQGQAKSPRASNNPKGCSSRRSIALTTVLQLPTTPPPNRHDLLVGENTRAHAGPGQDAYQAPASRAQRATTTARGDPRAAKARHRRQTARPRQSAHQRE